MKKKLFKLLLCLITCFGLIGCGSKNNVDITEEKTSQITENKNDKGAADRQEEQESSHIIGRFQCSIPSGWVTVGNSFYKDGREQIFIDIYEYDKKKLKSAFGYTTDEECIRNYFYNGSEVLDSNKYTEKELFLPSYRFHMVADKYYKANKGDAADCSDPIVTQAFIDEENKTLYIMYFLDEMADDAKVDEFLDKIKEFDETSFYDEDCGLYRWQNGAEFYGN